jgi:hypothetical protein
MRIIKESSREDNKNSVIFKNNRKKIEDMPDDIKSQMTQCFDDASKKWALQIYESTDISIKAQLLVF